MDIGNGETLTEITAGENKQSSRARVKAIDETREWARRSQVMQLCRDLEWLTYSTMTRHGRFLSCVRVPESSKVPRARFEFNSFLRVPSVASRQQPAGVRVTEKRIRRVRETRFGFASGRATTRREDASSISHSSLMHSPRGGESNSYGL